jgi:DNA-binding NtrC family response regulator/tetratricopeptide (TPR) repeat protein
MVKANRVRQSSSASDEVSLSQQELIDQIEAGRKAAADFRHDEAITYFEAALESPLLNTEQRATVRCALAESLENIARYRDAIAVMSEYETPPGRAGLHSVVMFQVWLRLGSVHGYAGDHPRAISYLKSALALAEERNDPEDLGVCHLVLGRIYRAIGETRFARDHLRTALQHHRYLGQWYPLAQNYLLLGLVFASEGNYQSARDHFEQAIKIIGDRRAPLLLGSIYTNLANVILFREYGQVSEGVEVINRAIFHLKQAKNDRLLAYAYSNLGTGLVHIGDWERAEQALNYAIELGRAAGDRVVESGSLDSLGELYMMRGEVAEAERVLGLAIECVQAANSPASEAQAYQTLGRCFLARGDYERARDAFEQELVLANKVEDQRLSASAQLYLAEVKAGLDDVAGAQFLLSEAEEAVELSANQAVRGHLRLLTGRLRAREGNYEEARHQLSQAVAIFEMITDQYQEAAARYRLGNMWAQAGQLARARAELIRARDTCLRLGAQPLLARIEVALSTLGTRPSEEQNLSAPALPAPAAFELSNAVVLRLIGASSAREFLLQELVTIIRESFECIPVIAFEEVGPGKFKHVAISGGDGSEAASLGEAIKEALASSSAGPGDGVLHKLRAGEGAPFVLYLGARSARPPRKEAIEPLLKLAESCLELCALREQTRSVMEYEAVTLKPELYLPGLVFSSPVMQSLVEDIHKIRSSRVTVLITGESGTGKEVFARAIHMLSERREGPFVPFNCTVAPGEIITSQLFGHKKGAFTGAVSDYPGVIRTAAGGTLFLDEVGDLTPEVQPKLLRFLQEGEIQPLGESKPAHVDVRVIAATNSDIERLVAEGRFREDLYYRLNIIRLRIPPLRERREEIPLLAEHFLNLYSQQSNKEGITLSPQVLDLLMVYDWPGNVRQLANEMQRLVAYIAPGGTITERDLSPTIFRGSAPPRAAAHGGKSLAAVTNELMSGMQEGETLGSLADEYPLQVRYHPGRQTLGDLFSELERQLIIESMRRHKGKRTRVCEELGITRKGLYLKLRRYKIE